MKIVYLIDSFGKGGRERQLTELIFALSIDNDIEIFIFGPAGGYPLPLAIDKVHHISNRKSKRVGTFLSVVRMILRGKPDIIHFWDNISGIYGVLCKLVYKVVLIDGSIRHAGEINRSIPISLIRWVCFYISDVIVANSYAGLSAEKQQDNPKAKVIYNGIDLYKFGVTSCRKKAESEATRIVMVANFTKPKDYGTVLTVSLDLINMYTNLEFIFVGDGPNRKKTETAVPAEHKHHFTFTGRVSNVERILVSADIGVLLSNTNGHAEGISNSIMEYMAAELPVIATNAGGTPEIVKDCVTGFLIEPYNVKQAYDKLALLIEDTELRVKMGKHGRLLLESKFTLDLMVENYKKLYSETFNYLH